MSDGLQQMVESLRNQNMNQFERLTKLEEDISMIKADLFGATGNNGLRGEFRAYKTDSEKRGEEILSALTEVKNKQEANLKWTVGLLLSVPAVVAGIVRLAGG